MGTEARNYPCIVVPPPGPNARAVIERDAAWASTSYIKEYPLAVSHGRGAMIEDVDGNRYLDFMAGIAVASTGHAHPKVVAAIQEAASRFLHICGTDFYYETMVALCERLARVAPGRSKKRVFLTNSGAEAVEGAIKLARNSTRRPALIAFDGAFHGRTYGAMSLTSSKAVQRAGFGLPVTDIDRLTVRYASPLALMADLRKMGAANALIERRRTPLKRATLARVLEIYGARFADPDGRIRATFEIVWLSGWAPHESQQKPLRPGSARSRLADALGTHEISRGEKPGGE